MKRILLPIFSLCIISQAFAQHAHFGIKGGVNLSNLRTETDAFDYKTGFHAGIFTHIHLAKHFALQPELLYSLQGAESKNSVVNNDIKLGYINVPVLGQYMFNNGFRFETGPQLSLLVSAENKVNNVELDIKDNINSFDIGWAFGVGYITKSKFGFDARYNLGFTAVNETGSDDRKNGVFQIGVFYQFEGR